MGTSIDVAPQARVLDPDAPEDVTHALDLAERHSRNVVVEFALLTADAQVIPVDFGLNGWNLATRRRHAHPGARVIVRTWRPNPWRFLDP